MNLADAQEAIGWLFIISLLMVSLIPAALIGACIERALERWWRSKRRGW